MVNQGGPGSRIYQLAANWDRRLPYDKRESFNYSQTVDELLFHANLRFGEYIQYENQEGPFVARLLNWINNVTSDREKQSMLKLASLIDFVDRGQMLSLYRDAYKRIITPIITEDFSSAELISAQFESKSRRALKKYRFYSITESFNGPEFINKNSLSGLIKFDVFTENPSSAILRLPKSSSAITGLIILEDFVGTGTQSGKILKEIHKKRPSWKLIFIPLIILQNGYERLISDPELSNINVKPVLTISNNSCLKKEPGVNEPVELPYVRTIIEKTAMRVLTPLIENDDSPTDEFGYQGSGCLLITYHNTSNNTPPLIHHRAPNWNPLFRRVHHSKDGL